MEVKHEADLDKQVRASYLETFTHHLMIGVGESYFAAFILALGFSESRTSWLTSVPIGVGALLQFFTLKILREVRSHKLVVIAMALIQALTYLPLMWLAYRGYGNFKILAVVLSLYWFAAFSYGPSWNFWISKLIPTNRNRSFFANRSRLQQIGLFVSLIGAGVLLHSNFGFFRQLDLFFVLFTLAVIYRLMSTLALSFHHYKDSWAQPLPFSGVPEALHFFWKDKERRSFFLSLVPFTFCVNLTAPLVAPYLLKQVKLPYDHFSLVIAALVVGKIISTFLIQTRLRHLDPKRLILMGAVGAAPLPMLWTISENMYFMMILQVASGAAWVLFDVGLSLYFYSDLKDDEKIIVFTTFNFLNSFAILAGGFVGSHILQMLGETKNSYATLFLSGGFIRAMVALLVNTKNSKLAP